MSKLLQAKSLVDNLLCQLQGLPSVTTVDESKVADFIEKSWDDSVLQTLQDYIAIPNQSPEYDPQIHTNGYQEKAVTLLTEWVKKCNVKKLKMDVLHEKDRTPLIFVEVEASKPEFNKYTVLMYGHFDKQPPLTDQWEKDLHPWKPVIKGDKLYGRGGADDGYSIFGSIDCIRALQEQGADHPRCVIIIEGSEESDSPDLDYYFEKLRNRIGKPQIVFCLDSGCGNYEQLWLTVSLRGLMAGVLKSHVLKEGIHSGSSGIARDSFHIVRQLLDRIDEIKTGKILVPELHTKIPDSHVQYAKEVANVLGDAVWKDIPFFENCQPQLPATLDNAHELILNQTWRPQLAIVGVEGIPDLKGGNVLRPFTTLKLSIRLPPAINPESSREAIIKKLEANPPYNSKVEFVVKDVAEGFVCPEFKPWLMDSIQQASKAYFKKPALCYGVGGTIPLMGQLKSQFPDAQFVVTGILGPNSNAHGPNEFLHIPFTKRLICCMANILNACCVEYQNEALEKLK